MNDNVKPRCKLIGEDGNIFFILARVRRALKVHGKDHEAEEVCKRVTSSKSYEEALGIIAEYVEVE